MKKIFYFLKLATFFVFIGFTFSILGCKAKFIPSTSVEYSLQNKSIVAFLEVYKQALEKKSVESVLALVAPDFEDNAASEDPKGKFNYLRLKERLENHFSRVKNLNLGMFVQHIKRLEKDLYEVVFYFNEQALLNIPNQDEWVSIKDVNRMVLRKKPAVKAPYNYEIVSGI